MRKMFEFVKVGGVWMLWLPNYDGPNGLFDLVMTNGSDKLLDSINSGFVRLQMVDQAVAKITLSKMEEDENGVSYLCKSKFYNGRVWLNPAMLEVFGENPQVIYFSEI